MERIHEIMILMHDVNPVHDDPELIAARGLRGAVNQGPANLSYIVNMLTAWAGEQMFLERLDFRFLDVVVPGDVVTARGTVTGVDVVEGGTRVRCDVRLELPDGTDAVRGTAQLLVPGAC
jgi:acyl dehydratase